MQTAKYKITSSLFSDREANTVDQSGRSRSPFTKGVTVYLYWNHGVQNPTCAEIISGDHHAEIELRFEGRELVDFDGAFFLPGEVAEVLGEVGYTIADDCVA